MRDVADVQESGFGGMGIEEALPRAHADFVGLG